MSTVIHGHDRQIDQLVYYLQNYKALCRGECPQQPSPKGGVELDLETKYYMATVTLHPVVLGTEPHLAAEGFILLPSPDDGDLQSALYSAAHRAVEEDVNLRLLVALSDELHTHAPDAIRGYEEWALDNGFEFIEIGRDNITEGFADRDKSGLPRLMEALESNMWSTMRKRKPPSSTAHSAPAAQSQVAEPALVVDKPEGATTGPAETAFRVASSAHGSEVKEAADISEQAKSAAGQKEGPNTGTEAATAAEGDPFKLETADVEEDEIIDKYSNFINEVKEFRELASAGGLSDQARRDQAAAMAMKLSQMFGLDSDSDSDA